MKRAAIYLRVSTVDQTTANQERELREIASRSGMDSVKVYKDLGISGAKGRDKRPGFDALCRDAAKRQFDVVIAWSVDRLGRSLQDLVGFLSEIHALGIDLSREVVIAQDPLRIVSPKSVCVPRRFLQHAG
jgi:DNA invertase Pin-like site-specific DNA recombinase